MTQPEEEQPPPAPAGRRDPRVVAAIVRLMTSPDEQEAARKLANDRRYVDPDIPDDPSLQE